MSHRPPILILLPLGVAFSALWSSAFIAGKIAVGYANPISLLVFRFAIAGVIIFGFSFLVERGRLFDRRLIAHGAALGALNNAVYLGLTFKGLEYISPALTTLIISTAPSFTLALSNLLLGEKVNFPKIAGVIVGFIGVYIVVSRRLGSVPTKGIEKQGGT